MPVSVGTSLSQVCQCLIYLWFCELTGISWVVLLLSGTAVLLGLDWAGTTETSHLPVTGSPGQDFLWGSSLGLRTHERLSIWEPGLWKGTGGRQSEKPAPKYWVAGTSRQLGWLECWRAGPFFLSPSSPRAPFSLLWLLHELFLAGGFTSHEAAQGS